MVSDNVFDNVESIIEIFCRLSAASNYMYVTQRVHICKITLQHLIQMMMHCYHDGSHIQTAQQLHTFQILAYKDLLIWSQTSD